MFLLSVLAYLGKSRRDMAVVSVSFSAAVFLTYLLLGVGIFLAIKTFAANQGIFHAPGCTRMHRKPDPPPKRNTL